MQGGLEVFQERGRKITESYIAHCFPISTLIENYHLETRRCWGQKGGGRFKEKKPTITPVKSMT